MKERQFHEYVGGRKNHEHRFLNKHQAPLIRFLIVLNRSLYGLSNQEIAKNIGTSGSTLSHAAYGRAGIKTNPDGKSTTKKIFQGLIKHTIYH